MPNILIADRVHPVLLDRFRQIGLQLEYIPTIRYKEFCRRLPEVEGVVINSKTPMRKEQIELAGSLSFIARLGSGLDIIDLSAAARHQVAVFSAPEGNANAVAEHAMGMLLQLLNHSIEAHQMVRNIRWNREKVRGEELEGKTIGVIGYGNNGSAFTRLWQGFKVNVLIYDKYRKRFANDIRYAKEATLQEVVQEADIVSLHIPLTDETRQWFDWEMFQKMKKGSIFINTSRGNIVNHRDLLYALHIGQIGGACLDVFENEKPLTYSEAEKVIYDSLFQKSNVVASPHVAGWTKQSFFKIANTIADKVEEYYESMDKTK